MGSVDHNPSKPQPQEWTHSEFLRTSYEVSKQGCDNAKAGNQVIEEKHYKTKNDESKIS